MATLRTLCGLALSLALCATGTLKAESTAATSQAPRLVAAAPCPAPIATKGTLYIVAKSFAHGHHGYGIEEITAYEVETGREWGNTYNIIANVGSEVTLRCDEATLGSHIRVHIRWRAQGRDHRHDDGDVRHERPHNRDRHDCDEYDHAESGSWERPFIRSGQIETFYNP